MADVKESPMPDIAGGKNFAGDATWNHLNDLVVLSTEDTSKSEIDLLKKYVPPTNGGQAFEIGSFPGSNLGGLAHLGYTLNGIDITPRNAEELPALLQEKGYKTGDFYSADIFTFKTEKKYDLVCSFGFVEHFENYLEVIKLHTTFVSDDGYLVITAPNFRGWLQHAVHYLFDKSNLNIHNVKSMRPKQWAAFLEKEGFEILFAGYIGGLYFWLGNKGRNKFEKFLLYLLHGTAGKLRKVIKGEAAAYSYNCGVVAKKKVMK